MDESLTQQRRVEDEGRKIVNSFFGGRKSRFVACIDCTLRISPG